MAFKYETHTHNNVSSACGRISPEDLVRLFYRQDYTGIFITDHFFNGNTVEPGRGLPWRIRVEKYCEAFFRAKAEGDKLGIDVFFGVEYTVPHRHDDIVSNAGCDFLVYNVTPDWLIDHGGDVDVRNTSEYLNSARADGAIVVQAHPFRLAGYMDHVCLFPDCVDGIEVLNGNPNTMGIPNDMANAYAEAYGFFKTAGTDIHGNDRDTLLVTELPQRAVDTVHFFEMHKNGEQRLSICPNRLIGVDKL